MLCPVGSPNLQATLLLPGEASWGCPSLLMLSLHLSAHATTNQGHLLTPIWSKPPEIPPGLPRVSVMGKAPDCTLACSTTPFPHSPVPSSGAAIRLPVGPQSPGGVVRMPLDYLDPWSSWVQQAPQFQEHPPLTPQSHIFLALVEAPITAP